MSVIETLDLTASFNHVADPTPFGIYDSDVHFSGAADGMVEYVYRKFGGSLLQVELTNKDVYTCLEEAVLEYSAMINSYNAKSMLADIIGAETGSLEGKEQKLARMSLALANRRADSYSSEAMVGGTRPLYSASIAVSSSQEKYNLQELLIADGTIDTNQRIVVKEMFHFSPTAAYRFFDTTSAVNYLHNQFSFESFSPETVFYLLPIWEDVLRAQQLEQSHRIRRSNYSYDIVDNVLKLYPVPTSDVTIHFTYYLNEGDPFSGSNDPAIDGISSINNVPFGNISYFRINSMGKQWIRRFALALSKEVLGQVRNKVTTIPIPNGDLTLNGADLIMQGREEQTMLREELRTLLDSMTYDKLAQQEMEAADNLKRQLAGVPVGIFVRTIFSILFRYLQTIYYMSVKCLECKKEFKSSLSSHLVVHGLNKESYLEKFPRCRYSIKRI